MILINLILVSCKYECKDYFNVTELSTGNISNTLATL